MSYLDPILKSLNLIPQDAKSWDSKDFKARPFIDQVVRNMKPKLTATQRGRLVDFVGPHVAEQLRGRLNAATSKDLIQIARDLQTNEQFSKVLNDYQTAYEQKVIGVPLTEIDKGSMQVDSQVDTGNYKLRPRFQLATEDTLKESREQSLNDIVNADMFDFRVPGDELGRNNGLYIDNLKNERLRFADPLGVPRAPDNLERLVGIRPIVPQWDGPVVESQIDDIIVDRIRDEYITAGLKSLPPISIGLHDTTNKPDPYGYYRPNNFLIPTDDLTPGFRRDITQGVAFGELNELGFKKDYDYSAKDFRDPSRMQDMPIQTREQQLSQLYSMGFDCTFSTGFQSKLPEPDKVDLKGNCWIKN